MQNDKKQNKCLILKLWDSQLLKIDFYLCILTLYLWVLISTDGR